MIQQTQYSGPIGSITGARAMPAPPEDSLMNKAANLVSSLRELNEQLAATRSRIFGEEECPPLPPQGNSIVQPQIPVQVGIENAQSLLSDAHSQLSSILNRL